MVLKSLHEANAPSTSVLGHVFGFGGFGGGTTTSKSPSLLKLLGATRLESLDPHGPSTVRGPNILSNWPDSWGRMAPNCLYQRVGTGRPSAVDLQVAVDFGRGG